MVLSSGFRCIIYRVTNKIRLQRLLYGICIVRYLAIRVLVGQNWLIFVLKHVLNHQITQLNADTKNHTSNRYIFLCFWVVFTVSSFVGCSSGIYIKLDVYLTHMFLQPRFFLYRKSFNNYLYHCYFDLLCYNIFVQKFSIYREGSSLFRKARDNILSKKARTFEI